MTDLIGQRHVRKEDGCFFLYSSHTGLVRLSISSCSFFRSINCSNLHRHNRRRTHSKGHSSTAQHQGHHSPTKIISTISRAINPTVYHLLHLNQQMCLIHKRTRSNHTILPLMITNSHTLPIQKYLLSNSSKGIHSLLPLDIFLLCRYTSN